MDKGSCATNNSKHRCYHRDAALLNAVVVCRVIFAAFVVAFALTGIPAPAGPVGVMVGKIVMTLPVADAMDVHPWKYHSGGFQSGSHTTLGAFYSGGMTYDPETDTTFMTGIHYNEKIYNKDGNIESGWGPTPVRNETSCFLGSFEHYDPEHKNKLPIFFHSFGHPDFMEVCTAITAVERKNELVVVGSIEGAGLNSYTGENTDKYGFDFEYSATHPWAHNDYDTKDKSKQPPKILGTVSSFTKHSDGWEPDNFVSGSIFTAQTSERDRENPVETSEEDHLLYPVSVVAQSADEEYVYVAALTSRSGTPLINPGTSSTKNQINWNNDIYDHRDDKNEPPTHLMVFKFHIDRQHNLPPRLVWKKPFEFSKQSGGKGHAPVDIGGMEILTNNDEYGLIIVGNTRMIGSEWGKKNHGNSIEGAYGTTLDEDGFVIMINPTTGERIEDVRIVTVSDRMEGKSEADLTKIKTKSNEYVRGMCVAKNDPRNFVVVGSTNYEVFADNGELGGVRQWTNDAESKFHKASKSGWEFHKSRTAFVRRYSNENYPAADAYRVTLKKNKDATVNIPSAAGISESWTKQWTSVPTKTSKEKKTTTTEAIDCVVDGGFLYVVGNVHDSAEMMTLDGAMMTGNGFLQNNIWLTKMNYETGEVVWTAQLGGNRDDSVSPTGKSIAVNIDGNVIVYGDTTSNLYHNRTQSTEKNDVFLMTVMGTDGTIFEQKQQHLEGEIYHASRMSSTYPMSPAVSPQKNNDGGSSPQKNNDGGSSPQKNNDGGSSPHKNSDGGSSPHENDNNKADDKTDANVNGYTTSNADNDINEAIDVVQETNEEVSSLMVKMQENKLQAILYTLSIVTGLFAVYVMAKKCFCPNGCNFCKKRKGVYDRDSGITLSKTRKSYSDNADTNNKDEFHDEP